MIIAIKEIESWYMAGISAVMNNSLQARIYNTNSLTKEQFNNLIPRGVPRVQFMQRILDSFDMQEAYRRNDSFAYLGRKWLGGSDTSVASIVN
jgi:hypothetical protein